MSITMEDFISNDDLISMYKTTSLSEMGEILGVSKGVVKRQLLKLGVQIRKPGWQKEKEIK